MPRVGTTREEQTSGGQFRFEGKYGEVVGACWKNVSMGEYEPKCALALTIQGYDAKFQTPTGEPVTEELGAGPLTKFHPGQCDSSDSPDAVDMGEEIGVEGNCLFSINGPGPDHKAKVSVFQDSLEDNGFPKVRLNGFAPNLIGLRAEFQQKMMPKGENYTGKRDPTNLIATKIIQIPGGGATAGTASKAKPASAAAKPNGAPAAATAAPTPVPAPTAATVDTDAVENAAVAVLQQVGASMAGKTVLRPLLKTKVMTLLAADRSQFPIEIDKPVQALIGNEEWLKSMIQGFEWSIAPDGKSIVIPAAAK